MNRSQAENLTTLVFMALAVSSFFASRAYPAGGRLIPGIVAGVILILGLLQLFGGRVSWLRPLVTANGDKPPAVMAGSAYWKRVRTIGGWIALLFLLVYVVGLQVAIPVFILLFMLFVDGKGWKVTIGVTVLMACVTYIIIGMILELPWYEGGVVWRSLF